MLGTIISGIGAISGILDSKRKQSAQNKAMGEMTKTNTDAAARERQLASLIMDQFNRRQGIANNAINSGTFDPERLVGRLDQDFARNNARNLDNMAGAFATMGYRPGDSEPGARLQAAFAQGLNQRNQQAEQLRMQSPFQLINLLNSAEGGLLNRVAGLEGAAANRMYQTNANIYGMNQPQDIGALLGSVLPFLNQGGPRPLESGVIGPFSRPDEAPVNAYAGLQNLRNQFGLNKVSYR